MIIKIMTDRVECKYLITKFTWYSVLKICVGDLSQLGQCQFLGLYGYLIDQTLDNFFSYFGHDIHLEWAYYRCALDD